MRFLSGLLYGQFRIAAKRKSFYFTVDALSRMKDLAPAVVMRTAKPFSSESRVKACPAVGACNLSTTDFVILMGSTEAGVDMF
jgi:hypothetical protein